MRLKISASKYRIKYQNVDSTPLRVSNRFLELTMNNFDLAMAKSVIAFGSVSSQCTLCFLSVKIIEDSVHADQINLKNFFRKIMRVPTSRDIIQINMV